VVRLISISAIVGSSLYRRREGGRGSSVLRNFLPRDSPTQPGPERVFQIAPQTDLANPRARDTMNPDVFSLSPKGFVMALTVVELTDTLSHVALDGQLTMMGVDRLTGKFHENVINRGVNAIVDLSEMAFIASAGIGMLLDARKQLQHDDAQVVLLAPQEAVEQTFITARLDKVFHIVHTLDEAKDFLSK
jgi:anti-anti-sigma factor